MKSARSSAHAVGHEGAVAASSGAPKVQQSSTGAGASKGKGSSSGSFLTDIKTIRSRARQHMEAGAVTPDYPADVGMVVNVLNEALATEIVCVLRYKRHYFMAQGIASESVKAEFLQHANEES